MDKITKKRVKRYITWACMAGVVLLLTVMPLLAKNEAEKDGPQASILSAVAENGSITTTLHSGGTLEDEDAQDAVIPTGVKITGFLVKNGDIVKAGEPVATVDKTSVMEAITSVNETMDFLREELEDGRDEMVDSTVTAVPGGRVKKIFAREGESVQEVMLRDGALAVLSIDSMMAVQFETVSALGTGENVDVTLKNGTTVTGRVESNLDGTVVVTVDDEGYEVGQSVTVDGLGTGTLYIHNAWKATGYAGTISRIHAKEEQTLSAGGNLFALEDREFEGQLQYRANQHREYEKLLQDLLKMYDSGTIDAPCEGIVSGVDEDSIHLLAAEGEWEIQLLDNSAPKYRIVFLSSHSEQPKNTFPDCTTNDNCPAEAGKHDSGCPKECTIATDCKADKGKHYASCPEACIRTETEGACTADTHKLDCVGACDKAATEKDPCDASKHSVKCIKRCTGATEESKCDSEVHYSNCIKMCKYDAATGACPGTGAHLNTCIKSCIHADEVGKCKNPNAAQYPHYSDCIEDCDLAANADVGCSASKHKAACFYNGMTYKGFGGIVDQVATGALVIRVNTQESYDVTKDGSVWKITSGILNLYTMTDKMTISTGNASSFKPGDTILLVTGYRGGQAVWNSVVKYGHSTNLTVDDVLGKLDLSGLMGQTDLSGMMGGFSGYGNYSGMTMPESENLHDTEGSPLLTVTPHKTMKLAVTLDEQDISKIEIGMPATLKVEALKNQVFSGEVTEIGIHGTNNGGSSKYSATITLQAAEDMLPGMSASASIPLETKENVLTVPVAALYDLDGKTVVYTAVDRDSGELAGAVEVVTGVSDGEKVEILSGLSQGDTVYYSYYDTLEEDTSAKAEKFTFG